MGNPTGGALLTKSIKERRLKILFLFTLLFFVSGAFFWFFSPLRAQLPTEDYTGLLHRPKGFARYLIVPKVSEFYRKMQKNTVLKGLLGKKPFLTFFSSPPPELVSKVFRFLGILPENLQKALLGAIFPGALLYVSSEEGSILLVEVSRAGKLLLDKVEYPHKAFREPYYIIASTKSLLNKQELHKAKSGIATLKIAEEELAVIFDPENDPKKEERSLTWAFYRTFFPRNRFGPQTVVFSVTEQAVIVKSLAPIYWPPMDSSHQSFLESLGTFEFSEDFVLANGLFLQFMADGQSLESLILKNKFTKSTFTLPVIIFSGFLVDGERFLPDIGLFLDRKEKKLVQFFKEAFYFRDARESKGSEGEIILSYPDQEYYPLEYAAFRPHYLFTKEHFLWATSVESFKLLRQYQKNLIKKKVLLNKPDNEKAIVYLKGNLLKVLKSLLASLEKVNPVYGEPTFADFRETLAQWLKSIPKAQVEGSYYLSSEYLRGELQIAF